MSLSARVSVAEWVIGVWSMTEVWSDAERKPDVSLPLRKIHVSMCQCGVWQIPDYTTGGMYTTYHCSMCRSGLLYVTTRTATPVTRTFPLHTMDSGLAVAMHTKLAWHLASVRCGQGVTQKAGYTLPCRGSGKSRTRHHGSRGAAKALMTSSYNSIRYLLRLANIVLSNSVD